MLNISVKRGVPPTPNMLHISMLQVICMQIIFVSLVINITYDQMFPIATLPYSKLIRTITLR